MTTLSVQCEIGGIGRKATMPLTYTQGDFNSLACLEVPGSVVKFRYGANENGIFLLGVGDTDDGVSYNREIKTGALDLGSLNNKKVSRVNLQIEGATQTFECGVSVDGREALYSGRSMVLGRSSVVFSGPREQGVLWTFLLKSKEFFKIKSVAADVVVRSAGISSGVYR